MDRVVQPGQSYTQAVVGIHPQIREFPNSERSLRDKEVQFVEKEAVIREFPSSERSLREKEVQFVEKEVVGSCVKDVVGNRLVEDITEQSNKEVIEFVPMKEETKSLEGSMIAIVKLVTSISSIQERVDVDGGGDYLIAIGRKKVEEQMYKVGVVEEEWRSDPDCLLLDSHREGRRFEFKQDCVIDNSDSMSSETKDVGDEYSGPNKSNGLVRDMRVGPDEVYGPNEVYGPDAKVSQRRASVDNEIQSGADKEHVLTPIQNQKNRGVTRRRRKQIVECYPQNLVEIGDKCSQWVTARSKQGQRWKQAQQDVVVKGMKRTVSYHYVVVLKTSSVDLGPKPFRVLDAWQQLLDFRRAVEGRWRELEVEGYVGHQCKQKLKLLNEFLKGWNRDVFGDMEAQLEKTAEMVERIDKKNKDFDLEEFELSQRQRVQEMWSILRKNEAIWRQKLRSNWVQLGDLNTKFFQNIANALNEVVDEVKKSKQQAFVFKAGFAKVYDCADWSFLDLMMERFGFGSRWRGWIKECLSTTKVSVLVNGNSTKEFEIGKGLRGVEIGKRDLVVSLLPFTDDTVILGKADGENVFMVKGGLGVLDLRRRNWALLGKWCSRFGDGVESLLKWVVREKYYEGQCEVDITSIAHLKVSKMWKDIISIGGRLVRLRDMLVNEFRWEVGCGGRVGVLRENWVGSKPLRDLCPTLYGLAMNKEGLVSEMGQWESDRWRWNMAWKRERKGREKMRRRSCGGYWIVYT
ncbi:hypothetical protein SLEP1_g7177 [Rubroshorea leprosula]|uniref:Reverse transcriptase domain-containing protein n=1 Tax=Rubroshorea leprosula TaxID=152421 RepID=A0AAV5I6L3_9ROSI|nr:hypothetical protein SLEP1_g7177 [Rubroshorea leprosula]